MNVPVATLATVARIRVQHAINGRPLYEDDPATVDYAHTLLGLFVLAALEATEAMPVQVNRPEFQAHHLRFEYIDRRPVHPEWHVFTLSA